jgi:DNA polymerase III delta prime subunit
MMATLKDLSSITSELDQLGGELHAELTEGDIDFRKMVALADRISENADKLAEAFNSMGSALDSTLNGRNGERDGEDEQ